ncbi:MAG: 30S ribosomal protein S7 [Actinomycetota bacterium]|nr:30S ribosomal protein S7 [Actinomycetota bacterium]
MPRRGPVPKKEVQPDHVYNDELVTRLINQVLRKGKKSLAESIVYDAFDIIKKKSGSSPLTILKKAVDSARPLLEVRPRRVGGATYQVPVEVPVRRGTTLALRWIVGFAQLRKGKPMCERLAAELMEAAKGTGSAIKKREDLHKMAEANKAFAHYRW